MIYELHSSSLSSNYNLFQYNWIQQFPSFKLMKALKFFLVFFNISPNLQIKV